MTDIIDLDAGKTAYEVFEKYLTDLYWFQVNPEMGCVDYCMDDLLVVWDLVYEHKGDDYLEEVIAKGGKGNYPSLFYEVGDVEDERIFSMMSDWCEGERWAVVHAVYSASELSYIPGEGFECRPMKLFGRDDRRKTE